MYFLLVTMKKIALLYCILCINHLIRAQIFSTEMCNFQKNFLHRILNTYGDESLKIIAQDITHDEIKDWSEPTYDTVQLAFDLSTVIHEKLHGLNNRLSNGNTYGYFINSLCTLYVTKIDELPKSDFLKNYIPKETADSIFRYPLYIEGYDKRARLKLLKNEEIYSVFAGIYGLLEEFNAYHMDCYFINKIAPYFLQFNPEKLFEIDFFNRYYSVINPFYEFSFFTGSYLHFLEIHYSDKYNLLLQDSTLRKTFTAIYDNYQKTVNNIEDYYIKNFKHLEKNYSNDNDILLSLSLKKEDKEKDLAILKDVIYKKYGNDEDVYVRDDLVKKFYSKIINGTNSLMNKTKMTLKECKIFFFQLSKLHYKNYIQRVASASHIQSALNRFRWKSACK